MMIKIVKNQNWLISGCFFAKLADFRKFLKIVVADSFYYFRNRNI